MTDSIDKDRDAVARYYAAIAADYDAIEDDAMEDDAMNKLLAAESLDSVQSAMNRALAELDSALAMQAPPALASGPVIHVKKRLQKRRTAEVG